MFELEKIRALAEARKSRAYEVLAKLVDSLITENAHKYRVEIDFNNRANMSHFEYHRVLPSEEDKLRLIETLKNSGYRCQRVYSDYGRYDKLTIYWHN